MGKAKIGRPFKPIKPLGEERLRQVLQEVSGNRGECAAILKEAGYLRNDDDIGELINSFPEILEAFPVEKGNIRQTEAPPPSEHDTAAVKVRPPATEIQERSDELMEQGMKDAGITDAKIERFKALSDFVGHGFSRTVDFTYGVMVVGTMNLEERADYIKEKVLECEDVAEHTVIDKWGKPHTYKAAKYSPELKLEFQKEWVSIMSELGKYANIANNAALIRVKAESLVNGSKNGGMKKKPKRLKVKEVKSTEVRGKGSKKIVNANVIVVPQSS